MTTPLTQHLFDQRVLEYITEWLNISDYSIPLDLFIPIQQICDECKLQCITSRGRTIFKSYHNQTDYYIKQTIDTYSTESGYHTDYETDEDSDIPRIELRVSYIPEGVRTLICSNYDISNCTLPQSLRIIHCDNMKSVPILPEGLLELHCNGNSDTILPTLPQSLQRLNCKYSKMKTLPCLPPNLLYLDCSISYITSLQHPLPLSLKYLNCNGSQIETLPPLPPNLEYLNYEYTNIRTYISDLPDSLKILYCGLNKLRTIDYIPPNLEVLSCKCYEGLPLSSELPSSLTTIEVPRYTQGNINILVREYIDNWSNTRNNSTTLDFNPLETEIITMLSTDKHSKYLIDTCQFNIPYIPNEVEKLICNRYITSLPPLPTSLKELHTISTKSLPPLPDGLQVLQVKHINSDQILPRSLRILDCDNSYIISLPPLPPNLEILSYECTNIPEYITNLPVSLKTLRCGGNQFEHIGPIPPYLEHFSCIDYQGTPLVFPSSIQIIAIPKYNMYYVKTAILEYIHSWLQTRNGSTILDFKPLEDHITAQMNSENNALVYHYEIIVPYIPEEAEILICSDRIYQLPPLPPTLREIHHKHLTISTIPENVKIVTLTTDSLSPRTL